MRRSASDTVQRICWHEGGISGKGPCVREIVVSEVFRQSTKRIHRGHQLAAFPSPSTGASKSRSSSSGGSLEDQHWCLLIAEQQALFQAQVCPPTSKWWRRSFLFTPNLGSKESPLVWAQSKPLGKSVTLSLSELTAMSLRVPWT